MLQFPSPYYDNAPSAIQENGHMSLPCERFDLVWSETGQVLLEEI